MVNYSRRSVSGTITILPEQLANKIAAGEVVQRPESVVKELIENSIDAGATSISIAIKEGGKSFIQISDNGSGMNDEDAAIAFGRHATSKIKSVPRILRASQLSDFAEKRWPPLQRWHTWN